MQAELSVLAQQFETQGRVDLDLQQKAAVLREEWLRIADPFGRRERGETDRAIELFSRWMAKEPEAFTPVLWRGLTYLLDEDQTTQALADLEAAEKLEAKSALPPAARALALHRRGEISKARQLFRQARIAGRDDPLVLSLEARYQQETGNFNRAVFGFEQALQIDPDNVTALSWLADVLATCPDNEIRNPETAQSHARRACQLSNWSRWDSLLAYASSLASLGIFDNAAIHARKAVILAPAARKPNCQQRLERFQQRQEWQIPQ